MRLRALVIVLRAGCFPCLAALVPVAGCQVEDEAELLAFRNTFRQRFEQPDDPDGGTWINNGLADPDVTGVDPEHALSSVAGLDPEGALLADEANHGLVRYLTECALPKYASITKVVDGEPIEFEGRVGLAPEWEDEPCDQDCQEWVSACLLARTNVSGRSVELWLRADHEAIGSGKSLSYPTYEASFFGNLFASDGGRYICRGTLVNDVVAFLDGRTCSSELEADCGFTAFDDCWLEPRCDYVGVLFPMANDCVAPGAAAQHTITTYIHAVADL
jgi:hypothetical protein